MPRGELPLPTPMPTYPEEPPKVSHEDELNLLTEQATYELLLNGVIGNPELKNSLAVLFEVIANIAENTKKATWSALDEALDAYKSSDYATAVRLADELTEELKRQSGAVNLFYGLVNRKLELLTPPSVRRVAELQNSQAEFAQDSGAEPLFSGDLTEENSNKSKRSWARGIKGKVRRTYQGWLRNDDTR